MHLGPPVIHCLGNTPGRTFPPSGCGNCAKANCIEQKTTSAAKAKNLVALIMTPVWRWLDSALKGTSRPLLRSRIQCASATAISKAPLFQRFKQRLRGARHGELGRRQTRQRLQRGGGRQEGEVSRRVPRHHTKLLQIGFVREIHGKEESENSHVSIGDLDGGPGCT